ncbi:MAG: lipoprotein signal peptidase [Proteobacteria bacterium]|nr:lipoprotein signal peptidase [Pseudomonadota bacterium]MBU4297408.1 lipoprotein signal peptidase [Pseudomonadota bacterium]MCG2748752.1 signal peptidase II [Desulfobulbaceae bacterium]
MGQRDRSQSSLLLVLLAGLIIVVDQLTKWLIMSRFGLYEFKVVVPGFFNLTYLHNTGAAFGLLANANPAWRPYFFIGIALLALVFVFFAFRQFRQRSPVYVFSFAFIAGGAVGNLIDRVRFGSVVDFLDFYVSRYHWPAFNVADSAIVVGVGLFLMASLLDKDGESS